MKHLRVFENFDKQEDQFDIQNVMLYMVNVLDNYKVNFFDVDNKMVNSNDPNIKDLLLQAIDSTVQKEIKPFNQD